MAYVDHCTRAGTCAMDYGGKRISTILHVLKPHYLRTLQIWWKYFDRRQRHAPRTEFEKTPLAAEFYFLFQLWHPPFFGGPAYVLSCEISAKFDNRRPSYGDSNNSRWPPFAILDIWWWRMLTIAHVPAPHFLRRHQIWWRYLNQWYAHKTEFGKRFLAAEFYFRLQLWCSQPCGDLCMCHHAKFQLNWTIGCRVILILPFYPLGPTLEPLSLCWGIRIPV